MNAISFLTFSGKKGNAINKQSQENYFLNSTITKHLEQSNSIPDICIHKSVQLNNLEPCHTSKI